MKILEQLWNETLHPAEIIKNDPRYSKLLDTADEIEKKLLSLLTDEEKELFHKLKDTRTELYSIDEYDIFVNSFRIGARIMLEIMDGISVPPIED